MRCTVPTCIGSLVVTGMMLVVPVAAQEKHPEGGGFGYFMAGPGQPDIGELNASLAGRGYPRLDEKPLRVGGGGHGRVGRFIIGGKGVGTLENSASNAQYKETLAGGHGEFYVGYVVFKRGELSVYPTVGIGGGGFELSITPVAAGVSFDDVLTDPRREAHLNASVFLLDLCLNLDYLSVLGEDENGVGGFTIGVQAGYLYSSTTSDWQMAGGSVFGGPKVGLTGPYIRVMLGGGGYGRSKR